MFDRILKRRSKANAIDFSVLKTDLHSHLIPGIDDGSPDLDTTIRLLEELRKLGFRKVVTTPHITPGLFNNTEKGIVDHYRKLLSDLNNKEIDIEIEVAAEYYVDENFEKKVNSGSDLLTFSSSYILIETAFTFEPPNFRQVLFTLRSEGYIPVLAHPERYVYMHSKDLSTYHTLKEQGILFQLNIGSLTGIYSRTVQKVAQKLCKEKMIDFLGSDLHNEKQIDYISKALNEPGFEDLINSGSLKNRLL